MTSRTRSMALMVVAILVLAACGSDGDQATDTTGSPATTASTTAAGADTTSTVAAGGEDTATMTTAAPTVGENKVVVTIGDTAYELSTGDESGYITRCEANYFGGGIYWVIATAVDDTGARAVPNVNLDLNLPHQPSPDADVEFTLTDDAGPFEYIIASDENVVFEVGEFDGDLGSWTVEGNRITGKIAVYEYDHVREYFTASFDITCPED